MRKKKQPKHIVKPLSASEIRKRIRKSLKISKKDYDAALRALEEIGKRKTRKKTGKGKGDGNDR